MFILGRLVQMGDSVPGQRMMHFWPEGVMYKGSAVHR